MMGADMFLVPTLIPAIAHNVGASIAQTAYIVATFGAAYAMFSPPLSGLLHSMSSRAVIGAGLLIVVSACGAAALSTNLVMLMLARAASGVGAAVVNPTVWSCLQATAPPHAQARVMLGGTAVSAAGQVGGIPLGAMLAAYGGWRIAFVGMAVGFGVTWMATRVLSPRPVHAPGPGVRDALQGTLDGVRLWRMPTFSLVVVGNIAAQAARLGIYSYIAALFAQRYSMHGMALGIIGIVAGAGSLVGALISTATVSWWCRRGLPVIGFSACWTAVMFVGIALITVPASPPVNLIGLAISFSAGITVFGTGQSYLASTFAGNRTAISWNSSAMYIGAAVGTFALGLTELGSVAFTAVGLTFVALAACSFSVLVTASCRRSP
jgi:DHA1 family inner membrane transport protein